MKLHIFGASGSGVTTLGYALSAETGLAYFDSDDYFWIKTKIPFTEKRNPDERNRLIMKDLEAAGKWILGGSTFTWGNNLFPDFDLVVFLYVPAEVRMERLKKREWERYGDIIFKDAERSRLHKEFITWAEGYDFKTELTNRTLKAHQAWLEQLKCPVLKIIGTQPVEEKVQLVLEKISEL
ncbi:MULTISPECIES: adenylate kinase [Chryseobacterium]|uniref:Adenylate kinase family enzyme n=1 Tax=Chryseobacterium camelliae TaxID=1265445 RepID=A0ABU0TEL5_9FLAO|nr:MULTISPECIES: adenylate kinase [Chryseobacterium]MDT3406701.1 adenylate kinase family enzyme [Pseudacidovorax intermedius]MDQ1095502.1 adenylate kinase family enzyme [Chryseobacterium camelliae]MDQ1099439.1 adenylate kinase family enzyme [Chryseobacterium sp. SORGH_AS_1048]MDR6086785.1 adenylate kinase family enzyme [Chryseobacterium sp. SORGH_AS_0909]MDR6131158.1 adenylate kinase family enzyme [Chryseobacterium sp. SORGH_AS_1175]